ncbi:MAG: ATP-binding protein [Candidatus Hodarchaeales archaeon]
MFDKDGLIEKTNLGITTIDQHGNVEEINKVMLDILGSPSKSKTSQLNVLQLPSLVEAGLEQPLKDILNGKLKKWEGSLEYTSIWGKKSNLDVILLPFGEGAIFLVRDKTKEKQIEREVEKSRFVMDLFALLITRNFKSATSHISLFLDDFISGSEVNIDNLKQSASFIKEEINDLKIVIDKVEELMIYDKRKSPLIDIDLNQIIENQIDTIKQIYHGREIEFTFNSPATMIVKADKFLQDLFSIILSNAVVHNDKEKIVITIDLERELKYYPGGDKKKIITITIADNGPGIPEDIKSAIFKPESVKTVTMTKLGLPMVTILLERYKGSIELTDNNGIGTKVILTLPQ